MKKLLKTALVLCFFLIAFSVGAVAPKAHAQIASGTIGNTVLSWSLEDNGNLIIRTSNETGKTIFRTTRSIRPPTSGSTRIRSKRSSGKDA